MTLDTAIRVAAAVAAVAILCGPYALAKFRGWKAYVPSQPDSHVQDLQIVLDLATRLHDSGNQDAVLLCQKLMDNLLQPATPDGATAQGKPAKR